MKTKGIKIAAVVASVFVLSACGKSVKEEYLESCLNTGLADKEMCTCQYDNLKKKGSDSDIKHLLKGEFSKSNLNAFDAAQAAMSCIGDFFQFNQ